MRNFGVPTRPTVGGFDQSSGPHSRDTQRDSNSVAGGLSPRPAWPNSRGFGSEPFIQPEPGFDHREIAVLVFVAGFFTSVGVLLAMASAFVDLF